MAQTKVKDGLLNFPDRDDFIQLPSGTTAQRPSSPSEGYIRFNTTIDKIEFFDGVKWVVAGETPPTLTSVDYPGNALAADVSGGETILINGTNFASGISVTIGTTDVSVVTLNSPTQLAITSPALTAGDYDVKVTNLDGSTITALDFISYNGVPSWVTASGSLGSLSFGEAISTITLSATEPDSGTVTYAITSGALPVGLTLSSSGEITGTMPSGSSETTYSFTVTATDDENQSTDRSFTITGVVPFVNSQNFNTVTYTGNNAASRTINGLGFDPDLVWIKPRNAAESHALFDVQRPSGQRLVTNSAGAAQQLSPPYAELTTDGFIVGGVSYNDSNSGDYVAWCWKAGGAPSSNTNGTITSQVSANPAAGFSIVSYTGNGVESTVGHGLGETPDFIIVKNRTSDSENSWAVWNKNQSSQSQFLALNGTDSYLTNSGVFGSTPHNSSVFNVGNLRSRNSISYIAYCFAEVEGFSKFGSYAGNGSTEGNVILTGFEPAFLLIKRTNGTNDWILYDNKRDPSNPRDTKLSPNTSGAEYTAVGINIDFLENGFQLKGIDPAINYSVGNGEYIYMAFAADPNTQVPTKADSFNTVTYTGNGTLFVDQPRAITGVGFQPDFVWIKSRTGGAFNHNVFDIVRGAGKLLLPNLTNAEIAAAHPVYLDSFDNDGFTVNTLDGGGVNENGQNYVAWAWKAGGTPSINTDGSIPSVVSANPAAGFSIVSYTGTETISTIGHGLSLEPKMIIVKRRENNDNWYVYNSNLSGINNYLQLNTTASELSFSPSIWGGTPPNSTVFSVGTDPSTSSLSEKMIAYCFAEVAGFSKFGIYDGGTITSSNIVNLGFRPAFVMLKPTQTVNDWIIYDNKRDTTDPLQHILYPATSGVEQISTNDDYNLYTTPNGFYFNNTNGFINRSASDVIYMAFADQF